MIDTIFPIDAKDQAGNTLYCDDRIQNRYSSTYIFVGCFSRLHNSSYNDVALVYNCQTDEWELKDPDWLRQVLLILD